MTATLTTLNAAFQEFWTPDRINTILYAEDPCLGMLPKDETFTEKIRHVNLVTRRPQGFSGSFATAKAGKSGTQISEFLVTTAPYYGAFGIDGRVYRRNKLNPKALFWDAITQEPKKAIEQMRRDFSWFIHGNGGGALGQLTSAAISGATITLTEARSLRMLEPGMVVQFAATDGTSGSARAGTLTILSVGTPSNPTVTFTTNITAGIAAAAPSDYIFRNGLFGPTQVISGFDAWSPNHTGTPGTLFGLSRNTDPIKMAGSPVDGSTLSIHQAITRAARVAYDQGGKPDWAIISTRAFEQLQEELKAKTQFTKAPAQATGSYSVNVQYTGIEIIGPAGPITVTPAADAPLAVGRVLTKSSWQLASMGPLIQPGDGAGTGGVYMVSDATDDYEGRLFSEVQLICTAPGYNARVAFNASSLT